MQLDAFLRSAERYAPYERIDVLYRCDGAHVDAYADLIPRHREVGWWAEPDDGLERNVRGFLRAERVVFHTDDDLFFRRPPSLSLGVPSLRLGENTYYCHPLQREQTVPSGRPWRWREADGDFGYPLSLNGTIYRSADFLPLLDFHFTNPTGLEAGLAARADRFEPEWMTAPLHSCVVSIPHNRVTTSSHNPISGDPRFTVEQLNADYLAGWRIDIDATMQGVQVIGAHQEIPYVLTRC